LAILGWQEFAPYHRIIVTAGAAEIAEALLQQLCIDGKMLISSLAELSK
jgi:protein-L-isoaspartate O-methyltransferase